MKSVSKGEKTLKIKKNTNEIFITSILTKKVFLDFKYVDQNIKTTLANILSKDIEGKCNIEGYIKPKSISIISYSCGILKAETITFDVVFECLICFPVEGMTINCVVKDITKAGIRAELPDNDKTLMIFIARDHHYNNQKFSSIKVDEQIKVKVLGQRFELNDTFISIIAELVEQKVIAESTKTKSKPRLVLKE